VIRRLFAAAAVVATAGFTAGCLGGGGSIATGCKAPPGDAQFANLVVVLVDRSRSTGGASVGNDYRQGFDSILDFFKNGDGGILAVAPIDADSLAHFQPLECLYPKKGSNDNPLVYSSKVNGMNKREAEDVDSIVSSPRGRQGTSIFDGLTSAGRLLHKQESNADHRYLVIFSDMVENSDRLKMPKTNLTPSYISKFTSHEKSGPYFPNLDGVDVYVAGAGITQSGSSSLKSESIERFWMKYFDETGASLDSDNYGSTLTSFP
jgi:hypothetical protein